MGLTLLYQGLKTLIFTGTFENKVDAKGRVSIPAAFRALIQGSASGELALFPSFRFPCLEGMSFDMLSALSKQAGKVSLFSKGKPNPFSILFRSTLRLHIDDAGRITLPEVMIKKANLGKTAVFTGDGHSFQIWSAEAHATQMAQDMADLADFDDLDALESDFAAAAAEVMGAPA